VDVRLHAFLISTQDGHSFIVVLPDEHSPNPCTRTPGQEPLLQMTEYEYHQAIENPNYKMSTLDECPIFHAGS